MKVLVKKGTTEPYYATDKSTKGQDGLEEGQVRIYPLGGGFTMVAPGSDFEEVEYVVKMTKGYASIDHCIGYPAVNDTHDNWNGWAKPFFEPHVMETILEHSNEVTGEPMVHLSTEDHDEYTIDNYAWNREAAAAMEGDDDCPDVCVFTYKDTGLCYVDGWTWSFTPEEKCIDTYPTDNYEVIGSFLAVTDYPGIAVKEVVKDESWEVTTLTQEADHTWAAHCGIPRKWEENFTQVLTWLRGSVALEDESGWVHKPSIFDFEDAADFDDLSDFVFRHGNLSFSIGDVESGTLSDDRTTLRLNCDKTFKRLDYWSNTHETH